VRFDAPAPGISIDIPAGRPALRARADAVDLVAYAVARRAGSGARYGAARRAAARAGTRKDISSPALREMYGPRGRPVRLSNRSRIQIEPTKRLRRGGEVRRGKVIATHGQSQRRARRRRHIITNAVIVDATASSRPTSPQGRRIFGIGKAGNPDVQPGVDVIIGPARRSSRARAACSRRARRHAHPLHLAAAVREALLGVRR